MVSNTVFTTEYTIKENNKKFLQRMSRKVIEYEIDSAWETRVESQYTRQHIRVNIKNKHFMLLEMDAECGIPNCKGDRCNQNLTTIAKIRKVR